MQPLCTSWAHVEQRILAMMTAPLHTSIITDPATTPELCHAAHCLDAPVHAQLSSNPDAVLNTLRYLFFHTRCGVLVSVRKNAVALFAPFANAGYVNTWHSRVRFADGSPDVGTYARAKSRSTRRDVEPMLPVSQWWLNGGIVCNVMPADVWGTTTLLPELLEMLQATCAAHTVPDVDFFINKRDFPQLRRDINTDPYACFTGEPALAREAYPTYAPIFSFYTGVDMADLPLPPVDDWKQPPDGLPVPWSSGESRAAFRGTATGTDQRVQLAALGHERPDMLDAGLTGYNQGRDRVVFDAATSTIVVSYVDIAALPRKVAFVPIATQAAANKYVIYVDGHCAASRYGTLMRTGRVVLKVASLHAATSGHLWMFPGLIGARVCGLDATIPDDADHFIIDADLSNLLDTCSFLKSHDDLAARVAARAVARAPTRDMITHYMAGVFSLIHTRQSSASSHRAWFSPYDPRYARIGEIAGRMEVVRK